MSFCNKTKKAPHHQVTHAQLKLFTCKLCQYKTNRKYYLTNHIQMVHDNVRISCSKCNYTTTRNSYLKTHDKYVHKT